MKSFGFLLVMVIVLSGYSCSGGKMNTPLLVGTFNKGPGNGLFLYDFNLKEGSVKLVAGSDAGINPAFFCFSEKRDLIYTINEVGTYKGIEKSGGLTTLKYDRNSGQIRKVSDMAVPNGGPCHISISADNGFLFIANYDGGSVAVIKLDEGGIPEKISDTIFYEKEGDKVSHAHMIGQDPLGKKVYLTDLGLDRVAIYELDKNSGRLKPFRNPAVYLPDGAGPRHFVFNEDGTMMYLINELNSTITVLKVDENEGLRILQTVPAASAGYSGKNYCADIHIGDGENYLYGSNRGENSIVTFRIGEDGLLELAGHTPCRGDWPRNFAIDPSGKFLLVGNERSDNISVFKIDRKTGLPQPCEEDISIKAPACLKFP